MQSNMFLRWQTAPSAGFVAAVTSFIIWGFLPLYWHELRNLGALEILAYRIIFSAIAITILLLMLGRMSEVWQGFRCWGTVIRMFISAVLIGINWYLYIWGVTSGYVMECSLGYYITPLMSALFGCLFLKERPTRLQGFGLLVACGGVLYSLISYGSLPWLAISLAVTFPLYTLVRKTVAIESAPGLFMETSFLLGLAFGYIVWITWQGQGFWHDFSVSRLALLSCAGPFTSLPLLMFGFAARHMSMTSLGILQYIAPTCMLLIAFFVFNEPLIQATVITFICIWIGLGIYTLEALRQLRTFRAII